MMKIKKPLITRIVGNGLKPFPTFIVIVFLFVETGYSADGPLKLRPALQFSKMGRETIQGAEYFANQLIEWARLHKQGKANDFPFHPVWDGDNTMLGKRNGKGDIITLTPQAGLLLGDITNRDTEVLKDIFKEAVRYRAGIDPNSTEWGFLRKISLVIFGLEKIETVSQELIGFNTEERRSVLKALEQFQKANISMLYEAELFNGRTIRIGDDLFMHCFSVGAWRLLFDLIYEHCNDVRDATRLIDKQMRYEVFLAGRLAVAYWDIREDRVEQAISLYSYIIKKFPDSVAEISRSLAAIAVTEPANSQRCCAVAYALQDKGAWELYKQNIESNGGTIEVDSLTQDHIEAHLAYRVHNVQAIKTEAVMAVLRSFAEEIDRHFSQMIEASDELIKAFEQGTEIDIKHFDMVERNLSDKLFSEIFAGTKMAPEVKTKLEGLFHSANMPGIYFNGIWTGIRIALTKKLPLDKKDKIEKLRTFKQDTELWREIFRRISKGQRIEVGTTFTIRLPVAQDIQPEPINGSGINAPRNCL